jgi:putative membrane protein
VSVRADGGWAPALVIAATSVTVLVVVGVLLLGRPGPAGGGEVSALPALNAFLNGSSAVLLGAGFVWIRRRNVAAHRACMLSAFGASTLFLVSYVVYHARAGSVPFAGQGLVRPVYFALLLSHIVLAAAIVPLALTTIHRAWTERFDRHRRLARWTLPIWLYVSVTGVVIYVMLYHLYAPVPRP